MAFIKNNIEDFTIEQIGRKTYKVTYTSPITKKVWTQETDDHELITNILNGKALVANLIKLKFICKL